MLRTRLYLGLLPLLLLFIVVCAAATLLYRDLARLIDRNIRTNYRAMISCYEMREAATFMAGALSTAQRGDIITAKQAYAEQRARFQRNFFEQSVASVGTSRTPLLEKVDAAFTQLDELARVPLDRGGDFSIASLHETETSLFRTLKAVETLTQRDFADVQEASERSARLARLSINFLFFAMVGAILLSLYLSYRLARSLLQPLQVLKASAAALGEGQLDRDVPVTSADELGDLARTFNIMASKLRVYRDAMAERVTRARRTMEATLTSTPDPLFVIGRDGRHEVRNPAAETLAAAPEWGEGVPAALAEPLRQVLATGVHYLPAGYDQVVTFRIDREERHFLPRILAIGDELTGFGGAALILQDVTKFRLLDDVKSNLVSTVSHELKTPLTSLRMAVYLLLEKSFGPLTEKQHDLLETARDDSERLLRIINNLLDLSRLESGVSALHRRTVAVAALLDDMAREMKPIVEAAGQTIGVIVHPSLSTVSVDPERIRHVFINLLTNASKYSTEDGRITLYGEPAADGFIRFGVRDSGPGIPEDSLPFIFEKFYRVHGQEKKGAGLGLTIAREIVVAHGGSIACISTLGEGSDFYFLLPET
ncbi:MAG: HAMP domain-containing protein [Verrucomicrobia bacterium]|nr:HAMP domain-containing protein [Verrucomicrobiota bacterium]